ncbi:acetyl esterase/lipase [Mycolicibacterium sp. BK556]|uniref:alpha/beta hydrolase n=1 Tax=Mycobacteriaceae TaxID=1762 RepID=UPI00105C8F35|nr:alpha/beta hydrolase [Mycobacterium sp. BK086]MBB3604103.1 acetyl esterase/lipase [Mycolicibacterium sp. BK556]MBB3634299.1 acetyl esterase/lipase [Mycolicibacterium sp. BK607]TDO12395.1 acetyl esterase/lipase [Mycobacterium sp. BK086]
MGDLDYAQFDPELRTFARVLPKGYALHRGLTLPRALMGFAARVGKVRDVDVAVVKPAVTVRVHRPVGQSAPGPALLWIHGGGTIMGSAAQEDRFCRKLVNFTDVAVVAVEHRLAPEHPYPTPLEDCYAALQWIAAQPWVDPARIGVGGASAGGGFTAAVAQLAHDRGEIDLALQMMVYPMLDDRTPGERTRRVMWTASDNRLAWQWYLAGADPQQAVPARRADLSGLAPAWIGVGSRDLFYDECRAYADRLRQAGVQVHEQIADGAFHAFDLIASNAAVSQRFFASQCRAVRSALVETR